MSDVKCARMLIRAAERDIAALRFMRYPDENTPWAVAFRYTGVVPDAEPIDKKDPTELIETLRKRIWRQSAVVEGG